ncbi:MAG: hypothetical protein PHF25_00455 [Candidatus Margulisbacteria bacterium]|nr:hypothetical protein [Candidatus Margulisiibacteriota bacterium]
MKIIELALKVRNFLFLQTAPATGDETKKIFSYDTAYSHKEGNKKFYTISYVHNRDVVPKIAIRQAKQIKHTII